MPANIIKNESQLVSTRLLSLPNTFIVRVFIRQPLVNLHSGGNDSNLSNNNLIQDGGEDNTIAFVNNIEISEI